MKKILLISYLTIVCSGIYAQSNNNYKEYFTTFKPQSNSAQLSLFYSILSIPQEYLGMNLSKEQFKGLYHIFLKYGQTIKNETNDGIIVLDPEEMINLTFVILEKSNYSCRLISDLSGYKPSSNSFSIRVGLQSDKSIHYNQGDEYGNFVWDSMGGEDLINEIKEMYFIEIVRK